MITHVPSPHEFRDVGYGFLNFAWDQAISLLLEPHQWECQETLADEPELAELYWDAVSRQLVIGATAVQEGADFLLRAHIAEVSPFLLIEPRNIPLDRKSPDLPYHELRSVNAADLIKIHDATCSPLLDDAFLETYERLRKRRNMFLHSTARHVKLAVGEIFADVLETAHALGNSEPWVGIRRDHMARQPDAILAQWASGADAVFWALPKEIDMAIGVLSQAQAERYFALRPASARYACPACEEIYHFDWDDEIPRLAQLQSDDAECSDLGCLVCGVESRVTRSHCKHCTSTVIKLDGSLCLGCLAKQQCDNGIGAT